MPISQILITAGRASTGPVLPQGSFLVNGVSKTWAYTNATSPTYGSYTFPDTSTGSLHTLNGTNCVISESLGSFGTIAINLWFYPTSANTIIMSEFETGDENSGYHYTMMEISSSNVLHARIWPGAAPGITCGNTVNLNAWNHVYYFYDAGTLSVSLNNGTAATGSVTRSAPSTTFLAIGVSDSTNLVTSARYQGKFNDLNVSSTAGSTWTSTKSKYGL